MFLVNYLSYEIIFYSCSNLNHFYSQTFLMNEFSSRDQMTLNICLCNKQCCQVCFHISIRDENDSKVRTKSNILHKNYITQNIISLFLNNYIIYFILTLKLRVRNTFVSYTKKMFCILCR